MMEAVTFGGRLRQRGPELSDVEVLTMEIFGEQQGRHDDASIHRYFDGHWRHFFPNLGSYPAFARLVRIRRAVETAIGKLSEMFAAQTTKARNLPSFVNRIARKLLA